MRKALAVGAILLSTSAFGHSWYDADCCSDKDCAPYHGEVRVTKGGFYLPEFDQTIPYERVRWTVPADDEEQYHICIIESREDGHPFRFIQCFYAKMGGV